MNYNNHPLNLSPNLTINNDSKGEIRIGSLGRVDAGKSSTISVITHKILDDGNGLARSKILKLPHEQRTGRTSSVGRGYLKLNEDKHIVFIDLAGHEKYFKTTMFGISGYNINYAMVVVGANMGLCQVSKEHISVVMSLKIPIFFVVTKIDLTPEDIFLQTMDDIRDLMHKYRQIYPGGAQVIGEKTRYKIDEFIQIYKDPLVKSYPIFCISNKTGLNIDLLRYFISQLPPRSGMSRLDAPGQSQIRETENQHNASTKNYHSSHTIFRVNDVYIVNGVGMVLSGFMYQGTIKKGSTLHLGPIFGGTWVRVMVRSIHGNFRNEIDQLPEHQSGCLAIRNLDSRKIPFTRKDLRKGTIISNIELKLTRKFRALILVVQGHTTTIKSGYQPIINCKTVVQNAKVSETEKQVVRSGDKCRVTFTFMFRPEYLEIGDVFNFREGQIRGMGKVLEILE